jgi:hypothetical protein
MSDEIQDQINKNNQAIARLERELKWGWVKFAWFILCVIIFFISLTVSTVEVIKGHYDIGTYCLVLAMMFRQYMREIKW